MRVLVLGAEKQPRLGAQCSQHGRPVKMEDNGAIVVLLNQNKRTLNDTPTTREPPPTQNDRFGAGVSSTGQTLAREKGDPCPSLPLSYAVPPPPPPPTHVFGLLLLTYFLTVIHHRSFRKRHIPGLGAPPTLDTSS